ncbi:MULTISPECIES: S8 family serine peptidase [unclassified Nocardioides]|uniref:S8 family serine peptidase n=1 Tax=unclassified Nocardioides TaxID=2615069 RepID=UPI003622DCA0
MSPTPRAAGAALAATLAISALAVGGPAGAERDRVAARPADPAGTTAKVTLVTGDVVTLTTGSGPATVAVDSASGSSGGVQIQTVGRDVHVVPDAALPYLASGRLDPELFNVSGLVEQGYDDASTGRIPLIVQYRPTVRSVPAAPDHAVRGAVLQSINGAGISTKKAQAESFWAGVTDTPTAASDDGRFAEGIARIHLDGKVEASLADSTAQVGAPQAWEQGVDGAGVTVAVLDTGVDQTHPDLADRIVASQSFVPGEGLADVNGHGTHTASTVAGTGTASGGQEKGVAPGAGLAIGKVLNDAGSGLDSWIIDGMEWGAAHAKVVSMSLGSQEASDGTDPMALAVDELSESTGALFVIAAGNYARVSGIGSPGAAASALTVGAVDGNDERAWFQDMGPRLGDAVVKPEIQAPGVDVLAARSAQTGGEGYYQTMSGTSMATPHVAGAAALVAQQHPDWTGQQIKDALVSRSHPLAGQTAYQAGAGRLDVPSSVFGDVVATATRDFGFHPWPHGDAQPVERTVTYRNYGGTDVTLALGVQVTDDELQPAPAGLVTLGQDSVTVPAHGTADVTVTGSPAVGAAATYSGTITASQDGQQVAQTAVGLVNEEERYSLDVNATDRSGHKAGGYVTLYRYGDQYVTTLAIDPATGKVPTQRLRPGIYNVTSWLEFAERGDDEGVALLGNPHLVIDEDSTITVDARDANPVTATTPKASEDVYRRPGYVHDSGIGGQFSTFTNQYAVPANIDNVYAAPTGEVPGARYEFLTRWRRTAPLLTITAQPGNARLHEVLQRGSARWDGRDTLRAVFVGNGATEDYASVDARGRAVLVMRNDAVAPYEQAAAAAAANARVLVIVNDRRGEMYEYAGGTDVPVVSLTGAQGEPLIDRIDRGRVVRLSLDGVEAPPYLYDLVDAHQGRIPDDLRYAPRARDLATVTNRFVGPEGELAFDERGDCRDWNWPPCLTVTEPVHLGTTRVDYVSTQEGTAWYDSALRAVDGYLAWDARGAQQAFAPGDDVVRSWFEPVVRPRVGEGYWHPRRSGDFFAVNVPFASSGDEGVTGHQEDEGSTVTSRLYQDGTLVRDGGPFQAVQTTVPATAGWADYRFEMDTARKAAVWKTSTETHTAWDFRAETTENGNAWTYLPLLQLDYALDADLNGAIRSGRNTIGLTAFHLADVAGAGKVAGATFEVSYDNGRTWQKSKLAPAGAGEWITTLTVPAAAKFVSVRATAEDDAGNGIEQEVIRAVQVR